VKAVSNAGPANGARAAPAVGSFNSGRIAAVRSVADRCSARKAGAHAVVAKVVVVIAAVHADDHILFPGL